MAFPRRPSTFLRYLVPALLLTLCLYVLSGPSQLPSRVGPIVASRPWGRSGGGGGGGGGGHPIDELVRAAEAEFAEKLGRATSTLAEAAAAYRGRRGRHPPPGFDRWYAFAADKGALVVEDFWDQIYHDLEPFWALPPARIRKEAWDFEMRIHVRDGRAYTDSDWFWTQIWLDMIRTIEHLLPDMDIALNPMDEPRLVVPWEEMQEYLRQAAKTRATMPDPSTVVSEFEKLPPPGEGPEKDEETPEKDWEEENSMGTPLLQPTQTYANAPFQKEHYWLIARRGCPPDSAARTADVITDFDKTPDMASSFALSHMYEGFVANYTLSTDFCHQPDLQALEGIFVEPISVSATRVLFPMFGGSKLAVNNEILLPATMYWKEEDRFMGSEGADVPWADKRDTAVWRGVATGGRNRETNWRSFQRHRFVAMNNGSKIARAEAGLDPAPNFALPSPQYGLAAQRARADTGAGSDGDSSSSSTAERHSALGAWVDSWADVAFTDLMCAYDGMWPTCNYTGPHFAVAESIPLAEQFRRKYLPDVDGNSFSGRYLGFLRSTSLPVKATLWREWHDSRLVAWKHFVPMDNRFGDWYGIMEYFLGDEARGVPGHDHVAERIAMAGREWAARVLRKEDMQVYVLRLLLEYARVSDERRESMGWVGDLLDGEA